MSSGSYRQADVLCPYYVTDNGKDRIACEGITTGSSLQSYYRNPGDYDTHMTRFCCDRYWDCGICAALDEKYREDE